MRYKEAKKFLESWIKNFLGRPHPAFNDLPPCPYASDSLKKSKVIFLTCNEKTFPLSISLSVYDVILYIFEDKISPAALTNLVEKFNNQNPNLVALEDHPFEVERIGDCVLNNGKYPIILIQDREKLSTYRESLSKTDYYSNWPKYYLDDVINR